MIKTNKQWIIKIYLFLQNKVKISTSKLFLFKLFAFTPNLFHHGKIFTNKFIIFNVISSILRGCNHSGLSLVFLWLTFIFRLRCRVVLICRLRCRVVVPFRLSCRVILICRLTCRVVVPFRLRFRVVDSVRPSCRVCSYRQIFTFRGWCSQIMACIISC